MTNRTHLPSNERGAAAMEFALIAPIFATLLMGTADIAHTLYMQSVLQGTLQNAAREGTLETSGTTANQNAIDARIRTAVKKLNTSMADSNIAITRRYYKTFSTAAAAQAETLTNDVNHNNLCDVGDQYTDANNNGVWDSDGGNGGQGGARDIVVYNVAVTYNHMFPLWKIVGAPGSTTIKATTVMANQPYGVQSQYGAATARTC